MLPASVLNALKDMSGGALKVLIYLCSCNQGQPLAVTIPAITEAIGIQPRSVISALNALEEQHLITRIPGSGNQPNQYSITFPRRKESAAPPSPGLRQAPPPTATTPMRATTHVSAAPSKQPDHATAPSPPPTQATILESVANCYRPINAQEFSQLKQAYPDEVALSKKLARLKQKGSVAPEMPLGFFLQALTQ